jgi:hypothetical protein
VSVDWCRLTITFATAVPSIERNDLLVTRSVLEEAGRSHIYLRKLKTLLSTPYISITNCYSVIGGAVNPRHIHAGGHKTPVGAGYWRQYAQYAKYAVGDIARRTVGRWGRRVSSSDHVPPDAPKRTDDLITVAGVPECGWRRTGH